MRRPAVHQASLFARHRWAPFGRCYVACARSERVSIRKYMRGNSVAVVEEGYDAVACPPILAMSFNEPS
jgi:hypothetical protein